MAYKVGRCLLRELLHNKDMSQLELAELLNVKEPQINKYVNDRQGMSYEVAKNISVILNCQMDDLYEWIEVGNNE